MAIPLSASEDRTSVHGVLRERLLQSRLLSSFDLIQLVEHHQEVVRECHVAIEAVTQIQVIQEILA